MMMQFDSFSLINPMPVTTGNDSFASTIQTAVPSSRKGKTQLPPNFTPKSYSVILGRGKVNEHTGNRRLKILVDIAFPIVALACGLPIVA